MNIKHYESVPGKWIAILKCCEQRQYNVTLKSVSSSYFACMLHVPVNRGVTL